MQHKRENGRRKSEGTNTGLRLDEMKLFRAFIFGPCIFLIAWIFISVNCRFWGAQGKCASFLAAESHFLLFDSGARLLFWPALFVVLLCIGGYLGKK